ncbi:hypothetical protein [Chitinophaga sp. CF418]|uniref:hypothetical protein n=1 Tax=Chitinophaga sp. CF418 TaxID=1855287 RepID=UPI000919D7DD|nr:hypothetical protein [Chitinophaga sp. CF418]SHM86620.1 endonuclease G [Chitinophaga sp. CF418]
MKKMLLISTLILLCFSCGKDNTTLEPGGTDNTSGSGGSSGCGYHNGKPLHLGSSGGCYYINSSGNRTYVTRSECKCG